MMSEFGIAGSQMKGYWLDNAPVSTGHPRVLATSYVRPDGILIVLASWSDQDEILSLTLEPEGLGLEESSLSGLQATAPAVAGLQEAKEIDLSAVPVPAGQGLFIVLRERS
jgi:hypothetical protein